MSSVFWTVGNQHRRSSCPDAPVPNGVVDTNRNFDSQVKTKRTMYGNVSLSDYMKIYNTVSSSIR
jgi:hypothetical protein